MYISLSIYIYIYIYISSSCPGCSSSAAPWESASSAAPRYVNNMYIMCMYIVYIYIMCVYIYIYIYYMFVYIYIYIYVTISGFCMTCCWACAIVCFVTACVCVHVWLCGLLTLTFNWLTYTCVYVVYLSHYCLIITMCLCLIDAGGYYIIDCYSIVD